MHKMEFLVDLGYYMTPTAQECCDLFLPIAMFWERDCLRSQYTDLQAIREVPGIKRFGGDCKALLCKIYPVAEGEM